MGVAEGRNKLKGSKLKSVGLGSTPRVGRRLTRKVRVAQLKPVTRWMMLGTGVAGGRRRSVACFRERLSTASARVARVRQLRRMGVRTHTMVGVAVTTVHYGWDSMGLSSISCGASFIRAIDFA